MLAELEVKVNSMSPEDVQKCESFPTWLIHNPLCVQMLVKPPGHLTVSTSFLYSLLRYYRHRVAVPEPDPLNDENIDPL